MMIYNIIYIYICKNYTLLRGDYRPQQNWNQIYNQWLFCMTMHSAVVSKGVYDYLTTNHNCYSCDMSLMVTCGYMHVHILQKLQYSNILYLRYIIYLTHIGVYTSNSIMLIVKQLMLLNTSNYDKCRFRIYE